MSYLGFSPTQRLYGTATYTTVLSDTPTTTGVLPFTVYPESVVIVNGAVLYPTIDYNVNASSNICTLTTPAAVGVDILTLNFALFSMVGSAYTFGSASNIFNVATATSATNATPLSQVQGLIAPVQTFANQNKSTRLTVQTGAVNSSGQASYIGVGTGLTPLMSATTVPVTIAFAQGMNDYIETISVDTYYPAVPASNTSFLYATRISAGNVTLGSTLAIPQYGYSYNQTAQALLHFDGTNGATTTTDDFGNTVTLAGSAHLDTSVSKFGTSSLSLNGTTDYIRLAAIIPISAYAIAGGEISAWFNQTSATGTQTLFGSVNASSFGVIVEISGGKTAVFLSSTGSSWDVASGTVGTVSIPTGSFVQVKLVDDPIAGKIFLYVGGVLDQSFTITNKPVFGPYGISFGATYNGTSGTVFFNGHIDECEIKPYCSSPAGTTFTPPTLASAVTNAGYASDWINISNGIIVNQISGPSIVAGTNPTFTAVNRVYQGECPAGASTITSAISYAINSKYDSGLFVVAVTTAYTKIHNFGTTQYNVDITVADDIYGTNERICQNYGGNGSYGYYPTTSTRNSTSLATSTYIAFGVSATNQTTGYYRVRVRRPF